MAAVLRVCIIDLSHTLDVHVVLNVYSTSSFPVPAHMGPAKWGTREPPIPNLLPIDSAAIAGGTDKIGV
jgi:hypothetical protein